MNDHDLIIEIRTQLTYIIQEMHNMRDGTKQDILSLQNKAEILEKAHIDIRNEIKAINNASAERYATNSAHIVALESAYKSDVQILQTNKSYMFRKVWDYIIPVVGIIIGLILAKLGILNLK